MLNHEILRHPTKLKSAIAAILEFCLSIHSPSIYKLSMIRLVRKVHFYVDF